MQPPGAKRRGGLRSCVLLAMIVLLAVFSFGTTAIHYHRLLTGAPTKRPTRARRAKVSDDYPFQPRPPPTLQAPRLDSSADGRRPPEEVPEHGKLRGARADDDVGSEENHNAGLNTEKGSDTGHNDWKERDAGQGDEKEGEGGHAAPQGMVPGARPRTLHEP